MTTSLEYEPYLVMMIHISLHNETREENIEYGVQQFLASRNTRPPGEGLLITHWAHTRISNGWEDGDKGTPSKKRAFVGIARGWLPKGVEEKDFCEFLIDAIYDYNGGWCAVEIHIDEVHATRSFHSLSKPEHQLLAKPEEDKAEAIVLETEERDTRLVLHTTIEEHHLTTHDYGTRTLRTDGRWWFTHNELTGLVLSWQKRAEQEGRGFRIGPHLKKLLTHPY